MRLDFGGYLLTFAEKAGQNGMAGVRKVHDGILAGRVPGGWYGVVAGAT